MWLVHILDVLRIYSLFFWLFHLLITYLNWILQRGIACYLRSVLNSRNHIFSLRFFYLSLWFKIAWQKLFFLQSIYLSLYWTVTQSTVFPRELILWIYIVRIKYSKAIIWVYTIVTLDNSFLNVFHSSALFVYWATASFLTSCS